MHPNDQMSDFLENFPSTNSSGAQYIGVIRPCAELCSFPDSPGVVNPKSANLYVGIESETWTNTTTMRAALGGRTIFRFQVTMHFVHSMNEYQCFYNMKCPGGVIIISWLEPSVPQINIVETTIE